MADKAITELVAAEQITAPDLFVLQQNNTAKKLPAQVLLNWLTAAADGHGGIQSIVKLSTSGLVDTYRITLADTTIFDFVVTNGRAISSITQTKVNGLTRTYTIAFNDGSSETFSVADGRGIQSFLKTSTEGLVDTYTVTYNDGTMDTFTVKNGEKGDKGDNAYIWVKYASQEPTAGSHSFGDVPDAWIGVYWGTESTAPGDWQAYHWYQWKGEKGDKGDPATLLNSNVAYQVGDSGTVIPSGSWQSSVPVVPQGKYLWTRTTNTFNTGDPVVSYSVSRMGLDGSGSVSSVANISPDENGNVPLTASDVGALSSAGGDLTGELRMNGQTIKGLNMPTANDQAANMGFVNQQVKKAAPRNLLDNSDWRVKELIVNQRGQDSYISAGYTIDRWEINGNVASLAVGNGGLTITPKQDALGFFRTYLDSSMLFGKTLTFAVKLSSGELLLCSGTYPAANPTTDVYFAEKVSEKCNIFITALTTKCACQIRVNKSQAITVEWAALYEGEYTEDTLLEYQPKGYGAELAECKRYYQKIKKVGIFGLAGTYVYGFSFEVEFREIPTVNITYLLDLPEWTERNVTSVTADTKGVRYIYSDDCKSVAHRVDGYASADL